jgi:cobyrinic acid a,c-diamide synthase
MRIIIAGTSSGVGKTSITIGLMKALKDRGFSVQGFKCGPDYIDPTYHTYVTGRPSRNLDSWMLTENQIIQVLNNASRDADISIIEGVMGYYDGKEAKTNQGSTAEISQLTNTPVLLIVDCWAMARSAAAVVKGFQSMSGGEQIVGVIANRVGGTGHYQIVKDAIEQECGIPVVGYLENNRDLMLPERHLGLIPAIEQGNLDIYFEKLGKVLEETINIDRIIQLTTDVKPLPKEEFPNMFSLKEEKVTIAVAKDAAFHFYYEENIELLQAKGAKIIYFSPLADETIPSEANGLYIGGGFPEVFAEALSEKTIAKTAIKQAIETGMPTIAECGGFMYLSESIQTTGGVSYPMVGIIPGSVEMRSHLVEIGYREVVGEACNPFFPGDKVKGHVYHYSSFTPRADIQKAYEPAGYHVHEVIAGYTHLHFLSCLDLVDRWIEKCLAFKSEK